MNFTLIYLQRICNQNIIVADLVTVNQFDSDMTSLYFYRFPKPLLYLLPRSLLTAKINLYFIGALVPEITEFSSTNSILVQFVSLYYPFCYTLEGTLSFLFHYNHRYPSHCDVLPADHSIGHLQEYTNIVLLLETLLQAIMKCLKKFPYLH